MHTSKFIYQSFIIQMSPKGDSDKIAMGGEVEKEKDYYMQFEQNPDFRRFVRKLSRCR